MYQRLLFILIFFNCNQLGAQFWKARSNSVKIDSLEKVIVSDRQIFEKEIIQCYNKIRNLSKKLDSIMLDMSTVQDRLDSITFSYKELENRVLSDEQLNSKTYDSFCPDESMMEQVEYLKNCCCLIKECPNESAEGGLKIVQEGYRMAVLKKIKIRGSCWDYIHKIYNNVGFTLENRETIYKAKKGSVFQNPAILHSGDWVYHVNYSYHNVEHSAIFVCWKDFEKRIAVTLSYVGQNRLDSGIYGLFDLSGIYNVIRAKVN